MFAKKIALLPLIITTMFAQQASANAGNMQFSGSVTTQTCDINPVVDGTTMNDIDLGTIDYTASGRATENNGKVVSFSLQSAAGCTNANGADVSWIGSSFNNAGLSNHQGTAKGITVKLTADNASGTKDININHQSVSFNKDVNEFKFTAQMIADGTTAVTPGSVIAHAAYTVAYN